MFCAVAAVLLMAAQTAVCMYTDIQPFLSGAFMTAFYIASVAAFSFIKKNISLRKKSAPLPETVGVLADAVVNLKAPVVLCPEEGDKIIWYNRVASEIFGKRSVNFSELFSTLEGKDGKLRLSAKGRIYLPESFGAKGKNGKSYRVFILNDVTEIEKNTEMLKGRQCGVMYITVDNLEELLGNEQEAYRSASGEAETTLRKFAAEYGGVLKEYQQDKYIFLFEVSHLKSIKAGGFDILDKIRSIDIGNSGIPVTVSIGACAGDGTLDERAKGAQEALKTALQRGGDQAVIKNGNDIEIFGGRTKMQQKNTAVKARVVANELEIMMKNASNVLIMGHKFADFDAFGASVGVAALAKYHKVTVNIVSDPHDSDLDKCREWMASDISYNGVFIDRGHALELIGPDTLLVIVDVNNHSQFESDDIALRCGKTVIIDHHRKTADEEMPAPVISYIEPSAAATCELVSEMLEQVLPTGTLTAKEACILMAGILLDTNHFTKNTGTGTFSAALYLRSCGADSGEVQAFFKTELDDFRRELKFHENAEIYRTVTAISVPDAECTYKDKIPAAKAADKLLGVRGVMASFAIVPIKNDAFISARSTGKINVQLILEKLNGGGHFDSAGAKLEGVSAQKAVVMLKEAIDSYFCENNISTGE